MPLACLLQKKRIFRRALFILWMLSILNLLSVFTMLTVPEITLDMLVSPRDIGRALGSIVTIGLWNLYAALSRRVRNTMVN